MMSSCVSSRARTKSRRASESTIVDKVADSISQFNNPTANLSLTQKAKDRKGQRKLPKIRKHTENSEAKNGD